MILIFAFILFVDCNGRESFDKLPTKITITDTEICINKVCDKITSIENKQFHKLYKTIDSDVFYKVRDTEVVKYNNCNVSFYTNE